MNFIWKSHFTNTTNSLNWKKDPVYQTIIVLLYNEHINESIEKLSECHTKKFNPHVVRTIFPNQTCHADHLQRHISLLSNLTAYSENCWRYVTGAFILRCTLRTIQLINISLNSISNLHTGRIRPPVAFYCAAIYFSDIIFDYPRI